MTDLAYIWLTGNLRPDHNTIWRFFRCNKRALPKLFKRVVRLAVDADLVGFALHAVDGTKIQAVSSTESALHRSVLQDKLRQIDELIEQSVKEMEKAQQEGGESFRLPQGLTDARARRAVLEQGLARLDAEQTEHLSLGEPDARVMKSRQGKRLSYNAQAAVDHDSDLIVAADVTNEEDDHRLLVPMIDQVLENTGETAETTSADAGYFSGEQIDEAQRRNYGIVVNFEKDSAPAKGQLSKDLFRYDPELDVFVCPQGKQLKFYRLDDKGMSYVRRFYRCVEKDCPRRDECTKNSTMSRTITRGPYDDALAVQKQAQTKACARVSLSLRKEIVEHVFGNIKSGDGLQRFSARGRHGARAQWALACLAFDLRKLHALWAAGELSLPATA